MSYNPTELELVDRFAVALAPTVYSIAEAKIDLITPDVARDLSYTTYQLAGSIVLARRRWLKDYGEHLR